MDEKRPTVKKRGKTTYKKLNMKDKPKKRKSQQIYKKSKPAQKSNSKFEDFATPQKVKISRSQAISEFKNKGLSIVKGSKAKKAGTVLLKVVLPVIIVVLIVSFLLIMLNAPTGFVEFVKSKSAMNKSGEGFPIVYDLSTGRDITYSSGQLLVSTETDLKCYNKNGNEIFSRVHGFANPIIRTSKIRTLVYGLKTSQYKIETPQEELFSEKTETKQPIMAADISDCGVYAVATESDDEVALVTVYDKNSKEIYKYHAANFYVTGVTVSENGNYLCVALVSSSKAQFVSKTVICDLDETTPVFEKQFDNELIYYTEYTDSKNICVITDKRYINLTTDGINAEYGYNSDALKKYEISDKYILLYTTADANSLNGKIKVMDLDGDEKAKFEIEENVLDITVSNSKSIYILNEKLKEYNFDGECDNKFDVKNGAIKIKAVGSDVVVLYSSGIESVS